MDAKAKSLLTNLHNKFEFMSFDETTVFSLLILLREYHQQNKIIVGLSDFIAHREKDRGDIHKYLIQVRNEILKAYSKDAYNFTVDFVYSESQIIESFNRALSSHGLSTLNEEQGSGLVLCVLSLFQDINLIDSNKKVLATLRVDVPDCVEKDKITLHGRFGIPIKEGKGDFYLYVPVLTTTYVPCVGKEIMEGARPLKVVNREGRLHLVYSNTLPVR